MQEGFIPFDPAGGRGSITVGGVTFALKVGSFESVRTLVDPVDVPGPRGALLQEYIVLPDDFLLGSNETNLLEFEVSGLIPESNYDLTFHSNDTEWVNPSINSGPTEFVPTPEFSSVGLRTSSTDEGRIEGVVFQTGNVPVVWSGFEIVATVPEPATACFLVTALATACLKRSKTAS